MPPARTIASDAMPAPWQGLLWGTLPIGMSLLAILLELLFPERRTEFALTEVPARMDQHIVA